jgi:hypothetical protein
LFIASTMTPARCLGFTIPQFSKIWPPPAQVYFVRVHSYAHAQHMKVLNHLIPIKYGCEMQSVVAYSHKHDTTMSFGPRLTIIFQNLAPPMYNSVRVHPYAHTQHMKVLNHFIHTQYRCEMQSVVVDSLNHDTTMSFGLHLTPVFQNLAITCTGIIKCNGAPICPSTACGGGSQTLSIHPIWMWDAVSGGLQPQPWHHNIISASPYPNFPKFCPHLQRYITV